MGDWTHVRTHHATRRERDTEGLADRARVKEPCLACGSTDTECIFYDGGGSIIGHWSESEHRCRVCDRFSVYETEYDS